MVGMEMGHDQPGHRPAGPAAVGDAEPVEDGEPVLLGLVQQHAGIDDGEAVAIFQQPQVDMVELEGQRHAQPVDAGRDLNRLGGVGLALAEREFQAVGLSAHVLAVVRAAPVGGAHAAPSPLMCRTMAASVSSGRSRCGECPQPGSMTVLTGPPARRSTACG